MTLPERSEETSVHSKKITWKQLRRTVHEPAENV